jgi:hypothetical protein
VQAPENREWVTIIETISALGRKTRPVIIFKGKNPQSSWFDIKKVPDWFYTQTENAWTSNDLALAWLCKVFIPETKPDDDSYRILLMDGHGSHETVDFMYECHKHKIRLVYLPPHSSHVLQPLDLGTFASVKSRYRAEIANISFLDDAAPIKKRRFLECYQKIREEAMAPRITQSGWKATGLYPFDRSKGLNSSQLRIQQPSERPRTPTQPKTTQNLIDPLLQTPKNQRNVYEAIQAMRGSETVPRSARTALAKAGKAIGQLAARCALHEATISKQNLQLEGFKIQKTKKRVRVDPNTRFADIENIQRAIDESKTRQAHLEAMDIENQFKKASEQAMAAKMEDYMFEFPVF